jgi:carbonic anhydrase
MILARRPLAMMLAAAFAAVALPARLHAADRPPPRSADMPKGQSPAARQTASAPRTAPAAAAHGSPSTLAGEASADPIERLRERLAERLRMPANNGGGTVDLQVSTRTALAPGAAAGVHPGAAAPAAHGAPARKARPGGAGSAAAAHGGPTSAAHGSLHWGYEGVAGPAAWGGLKPEFNLCASGQRQSPIDIRGGLGVDLEPVRFEYQPSRYSVVDNGHTVQVNVQGSNAIEIGTRRFELMQFHFHRPSEERIDGRQFEMSLHLVHKDAQGRLAVVGVLLDRGPAHPAVQQVWNNLPLEKGEEAPARALLNPLDLLPADRRYYTYMGSLTTPPCSEGVLWVVMRTPLAVTAEQIGIFARIYPMNARPPQAAAGRRILQSD